MRVTLSKIVQSSFFSFFFFENDANPDKKNSSYNLIYDILVLVICASLVFIWRIKKNPTNQNAINVGLPNEAQQPDSDSFELENYSNQPYQKEAENLENVNPFFKGVGTDKKSTRCKYFRSSNTAMENDTQPKPDELYANIL